MIRGFFLLGFGPYAPHVHGTVLLRSADGQAEARIPTEFLVDRGSHRTALGPSTAQHVAAHLPLVDMDIDDLILGAPWLTAGGQRRPRLLDAVIEFANVDAPQEPYTFDLEIGLFCFQLNQNDELPNILGRDIINGLRMTYDCPPPPVRAPAVRLRPPAVGDPPTLRYSSTRHTAAAG